VETVRAATGVKVNDVILALAGAALRLYLDERGELPERPLTSFVPISVRSASDTLLTGVNRLSGMLVSLATDVADPVVRLMTVSESSRSAKEQDQIIGPDLFTRLGEIAVPAIMAPAGRIARSLGLTRCYPPFSVVISSFPGPPLPLYCGGSELVAYHPFGPIVDGAVLNITAMSYRNRIGFGLLASADAVPDLDLIARTIPESLKQLKKALTAIRRD
jgi:diacylglycerol O-acyltransferase